MRSAGPACATCREKARRCDRAKPICRRCITKGLECGGYPEKFRFCGLASRGKWKDREAPTADQDKESPNTSARATRRQEGNRKILKEAQQARVDQPDTVIVSSVQNEEHSSSSPDHFVHTAISTPDGDLDLNHEDIYLSPHSITSDHQPEIDKVLVSEEAEMLLAHYDRVICPHQIAFYHDSIDNPYRLYVLPLAYEQIGLLYAVLALSACHLGHVTADKRLYQSVAVEYQVQAITALRASIQHGFSERPHGSERDGIFAMIQLLLLYDICESGISAHGAHISGAVSLCSQLLLGGSITSNNKRTVFFLGNLVWLDIVRAFSGPERLCFTQEIREKLLSLSDMKFEAVNGCPRDLVLIIGDILGRAKEHSSGTLSKDQYTECIRSSIRKLYLWNSSRFVYPDDNPLWLPVAEAFRHACVLRSLRLLDVTQTAEATEIQESVSAILDAVAEIPGDSPLIELIVLPIFMAGADCVSPHSRHYVQLRLAEIKARSEMSNSASMDLLKEVWRARSQKAKHDRSNVPWMDFTHNSELTLQHDYLIL